MFVMQAYVRNIQIVVQGPHIATSSHKPMS